MGLVETNKNSKKFFSRTSEKLDNKKINRNTKSQVGTTKFIDTKQVMCQHIIILSYTLYSTKQISKKTCHLNTRKGPQKDTARPDDTCNSRYRGHTYWVLRNHVHQD